MFGRQSEEPEAGKQVRNLPRNDTKKKNFMRLVVRTVLKRC